MLQKTPLAEELAGTTVGGREEKGHAGEGAAVATGAREDAAGDWETVGQIAARIVRSLKGTPARIAPVAGHGPKRSARATAAAMG